MTQTRLMTRVNPDQLVAAQRLQASPAQPYLYTITKDPRRLGALSLRLYPAPDAVYAFDYSYRRSPRQLNVIGYTTGTASVTADSTTLTGTGTAWTSSMVGAIVRLSADAETIPTGVSGANPASLERMVSAYVSATELTLDAAATSTLTGVKHAISDPVDIEHGAMLNFLLRSIEKSFRAIRRLKPMQFEEELWHQAQISAYEADARNYESRSAMSDGPYRTRMAYMPTGPDVS
jgi:hypothetical protein